jgi:outer membrane protein assembly factor BamD (BamD/ComL family)
MAVAERGFRAVLDSQGSDDQLENDARFHLHAAVHRQDRHAEAIKLADEWLLLYPKDRARHYILLFQGISYRHLKREAEARACWQEIIESEPDSQLAKHATVLMAALGQPRDRQVPEPRANEEGKSPQQMYEKALADFFHKEDMSAAEKGFRSVLEQKDIDIELRKMALFYLAAAVNRQDRHAEYLTLADKWLKEYPKDNSRNYVLLFKGISHQQLGDNAKARACWQEIVETAPHDDLAQHAKRHLAALEGRKGESGAPDQANEHYRPHRKLLAADKPGGYCVITVALQENNRDHAGFREVADKVAAFHQARVIPFDGKDFGRLGQILKQCSPKNVLFVIPPEELDINFHRRVLLLSATIDDDIFPDFAFGYFAARDGPALQRLWQRTEEVHKNGLKSRNWYSTAVTSGMKSAVYPDYIPEVARAAGFKGHTYFLACVESDPDVLKFADTHLPELREAGVVCLSGNGDPEGIWLFDDKRNADRSKHWPYEPAKVGYDPKSEMPRLMAERWAQIPLQSPVVWSGTCHAAATRRVFVEGDIASTFGATDKATVHRLDPKKSLCLAIVDAGAVAFLAPIAANHGFSTMREQEFVLTEGATLGETIKATYDDVFLASRGKLRLDLPVEGERNRDTEQVMQGGGANRILIGDPALAPFKATPHPAEKIEILNKRANGFDVVVTWPEGFRAGAWDIYGVDRQRDYRIGARISLDGLLAEDRTAEITATVEAKAKDGKELPYVIKQAEPEVYHGRRYLHLQANINRKAVDGKFVRATFSVTMD